MTWSRGERLYHRLPEIYRRRDREAGEPLRALLAIAESQLEALEDDVAGLYENWFIETCEDWVVPYLGDLLGVRVLGELPHAGAHPRAQVAQVLDYRQRKGTPAVLERVARDVAGWPARAVEMFERVACAQDTGHVRPAQGGTFDVRRGAAALAAAESPFAPPSVFRTADVRRIRSLRGRFNLPSLGLYLWRLDAFPVAGSPAAAAEGTGDAGFRFDPLGGDVLLFNRPSAPAGAVRQAAETDLPVPISRDALDRDLRQTASGFYGSGKAIRVKAGTKDVAPSKVVARNLDAWGAVGLQSGLLAFPVTSAAPEVAVTLGGDGPHVARFGRRPADAAEAALLLEAAVRTAWPGIRFASARVAVRNDGGERLLVVSGLPGDQVIFGGTDRDATTVAELGLSPDTGTPVRDVVAPGVPPFPAIPAEGVAIDPERGRLLFAAAQSSPVHVDYAYGFAAEMGGGPYDRRATLTDPTAVSLVVEVAKTGTTGATGPALDLPTALSRWVTDGKRNAVIRFLDNGLYTEGFPQIEVPRGVRLALEAADGARPVLRPAGRPRIDGMAGTAEPGILAINGLLVDGGLDLACDAGEALRLEVAHSTLVPRPGRASLGFLGGDASGGDASEGDASELSVHISSSIVGSLQLPVEIASLEIADSILDAATGAGGASQLPVLVSGALPLDAGGRISLAANQEMTVRIGGSGPVVVRLRTAPADLEAARAALQDALRAASNLPSFTGATVLRLGGRLLVRSGVPGETIAFAAGPADPQTVAALELTVPPAAVLAGLLSGSLAPFPVAQKPQVQVTLGGDGPHTVVLDAWSTTAGAAASLQAAIRGARETPVFQSAAVEVLAGRDEASMVAEERLLVRPGVAGATVSVTGLPLDPGTVAALGLGPGATAPEGAVVQGVFSGLLAPFTALPGAELQATFGGAARTVSPAGPTATLAETAASLRTALRASLPADPAFTGADIQVLGDRLLVVPGAAPFAAPPAAAGTARDTATVRELALGVPPAENVYGLLSNGAVATVPTFTRPRLQVSVGGGAVRTVTLDRIPQNPGAAREALQAALAAAGVPAADVLLLVDPGTTAPVERLLVRSGGATVVLSNASSDPAATELKLVVPPARALQGLLSGAIGEFPEFPLPTLEATFGLGAAARTREIELAGFPRDLATLRTLLEDAFHAAIVPPATDPSFEKAEVFLLDFGAAGGRLLVVSGQVGEAVTFKKTTADPNTATDVALNAPPAQTARPLRSGVLSPFPSELLGTVQATVGTLGPRTLSLGGLPGTLDRTVEMLRSGLRFYSETAYRSGDVVRLGDRLLVLSGVLGSGVVIDNSAGSSLASNLRLTAAAGSRRLQGRLSGDLSAFPSFPRARLRVRLGGATPFQTVELVDLPATVGEAATELQEVLRATAAGGATFTAASVLIHGSRLLVVPGAAVDGAAFDASTATGETATVSDLRLLPAQSEAALLSGDLAAFAGLQGAEVQATFGSTSAPARLSTLPSDLSSARTLLETALGAAGFTGTRVTTTADLRLLVLATSSTATPSFAATAGDPFTATDLELTAAAGAAVYDILLSGSLAAFPTLTSPVKVKVTFGTLTGTADLMSPPSSLADARTRLEAAIRVIDTAEPAFRDARVLVLGSQLLVLPGVAGEAVSLQLETGSTAATDLKLTTAAGATTVKGLLSGVLSPFPSPLRVAPAVVFRLDGTALPARDLTPVPATLGEARSALESAFQAVAPAGVTASVEVVAGRLLLRAGGRVITVEDVAGRAQTATALRLTAAAGGLQSLLSGDLAAFSGLTVNPRVRVEIAGTAGIARFAHVPADLVAARTELQAAIRAAGSGASFASAKVEVLDNRLLATAGQAADTIRFEDTTPGPAVGTALALTDGLSFLGRTLDGLLSGTGIVLPNLSLVATFGTSTVPVTLEQVPGDLALLAPALQAALRAAAPGVPTFAQAGVFQMGNQLLVLPGQPRDPVVFTRPSPPPSPDLVALLRLGAGDATTIEGLLSGQLPNPPRLKIAPIFQVTLGTTGPVEAGLSDAPETLAEARTLLQAALRAAAPASATFAGANVEVLGDRLLVTAGTPSDAVSFADLSSGSAPVAALRLGSGIASAATGVLSGDLHTFPRLTAGPRFQARLGSLTRTAYLADLPAAGDVEGYRAALEAALRAADPDTVFALAMVRRIGDRFVVQPGSRSGLPAVLTDQTPPALAAPLVSGIPLDGLLSADLAAFTGLSANRPRLQVALGTQGFHTVELETSPGSLDELRSFLERALRVAHSAETYRSATVQSVGGRLLLTPGEPTDPIVLAAAEGREADLTGLKLDPGSLVLAGALLTGPVQPLPVSPPRLSVKLGNQGPQAVTLARHPTDLADAAALLQTALLATAGSNFTNVTVAVRGDRLHVAVPGLQGQDISFAPVTTPAPADPSSVFRLRLDAASAEPADGLLSGDLSDFPQLGGRLVVDVTIGGEGPHPAELPFVPFTPEEARESLEQAVRSAHGSPAFALARVILAQDEAQGAGGPHLVVLPGRPGEVAMSAHAGVPDTAADLHLTASRGARHVDALISGLLPPFVRLTSAAPAVGVRLRSAGGALGFDASFLPARSSLAAIAAALQAGIRAASPAAPQTLVALLGPDPDSPERLVVLPGEDGFSILLAGAATDSTSVGELRLEIGSAVGTAFSAEDTGPPMTLVRSTVFGRLVLRELPLASETLFTEPVRVERQHVGCVRYSYVPEGSETPRRFRCQPDLAIARAIREALETLARERGLASIADLPPTDVEQVEALQTTRRVMALTPRFTATRYGDPGYGQLRLETAREIATGAEDGSEIGAFQRLHEPERRRQLALLIEEYLRFGLDAGLFFLT